VGSAACQLQPAVAPLFGVSATHRTARTVRAT
jgi:hypothetical protein